MSRRTSQDRLHELAAMSLAELESIYYGEKSSKLTGDEWAVVATMIARHQMDGRAQYAHKLATRMMSLSEASIRKAAAFTLRCDDGCQLAMIFGRIRLTHPGGPPNNELLICWTRKSVGAELARWYISNAPLDTSRALPVACKHGTGMFDIGTVNDLVCHPGPEATEPDTWFPIGATRRMGDLMTADFIDDGTRIGPRVAEPPRQVLNRTVGSFTLGESWTRHTA